MIRLLPFLLHAVPCKSTVDVDLASRSQPAAAATLLPDPSLNCEHRLHHTTSFRKRKCTTSMNGHGA